MSEMQNSPLIELALYWGWALFHSLWLLAVVALALGCVLRFMRRASASARYLVMVAALIVMALAPALAFWYVTPSLVCTDAWALLTSPRQHEAASEQGGRAVYALQAHSGLSTAQGAGAADAFKERIAQSGHVPGAIQDLGHRLGGAIEPALPWVVALWMFGVLLTSIRLAGGGLWVIRAKRRSAEAVPEFVQQAAERYRAALKLSVPVRVVKSTLSEVPMVLGWLRPVILFPAGALLGLTPRQLETIIAHELAHLARHDPLVNAVQAIIEVMLFYHPAVWWVSRRIRDEREHCCDDLALALCADRIEYARALTLLEAARLNESLPAFSAARGSLVGRIQRLLQPDTSDNRASRWVSGLALLFVLTGAFTLLAITGASRVLASTPGSVSVPAMPHDVTIPLPAEAVGSICVRKPGTESFFDWQEKFDAAGNVVISSDAEIALKVDPENAGDLAFLDKVPSDALTGLLLGVFFAYRAGNEPPDKVYADLLQTEKRTRMPVYDSDMPRITRLTSLREIYLDHAFVSDACVAALADLPLLDTVSLVDTQITDEALRSLAALPNLRRVNLSETAVTDQGLEYLAAAPALKDITLDRTSVTDAGVARLASMKALERISLNFTNVTDAGVAPLAALPNLRALRAWDTGVTEAVRAKAGHGTGPNELQLHVPKVGIILSEFTASGETWMSFEYTHRHPMGIAQLILDLGYDLYAVIDPGTENQGYLPEVLAYFGLEGRTVNGADPAALAQLDVIVSGHNPKMLGSVLDALAKAVGNGVGFVNTSVFGNRIPSRGAALSKLMGIDDPDYALHFEYIDCRVEANHPILGDLQPGDTFTVKWLNGFQGAVQGMQLLSAPRNPGFCPLYVRDLGKGRVVNVQWQQVTVSNGALTPEGFYGRCINYAAGISPDATW